MTLKTRVMAAQNFCITGINYIFKYIKIENSYFTLILQLLLYFLSNECSLGEHKNEHNSSSIAVQILS